jgi:hypothetical protein
MILEEMGTETPDRRGDARTGHAGKRPSGRTEESIADHVN